VAAAISFASARAGRVNG